MHCILTVNPFLYICMTLIGHHTFGCCYRNFDLQQPNRPNYHDWVKERLQKWQCTCWSQEVWKLQQHLLKVYLLNWIFNKISRQIYKKWVFCKNSPMKNQNFYTIKIASTKATLWLENDYAIFWQQLCRAYKALFQCF